jgi:hypothetical protein
LTGRALLFFWLCLMGSACQQEPAARQLAGMIDLHWSGSDQGTLSGPAIAEWCPVLRVLEIRGIRGDTGLAVAIYPRDSLTPGKYRVVQPAAADSLPRANIGLRWASETSIKGFQGESGSLLVERVRSGELAGRVTATARSVTDTQRLALEGTFKDLTIRPQARGCVAPVQHPDSNAQSSDTQLH